MRDPFSLEPPDGDYVAYLDKLLKGKIGSLSPLSVTADNGMVTVRSTAEPAPLQGDAVPADTDYDPYLKNEPVVRMAFALIRLAGPLIALAGVILMATGVAFDRSDNIPLGMILVFIGVVTTAQARNKKR
ncbi:hypothetical protein [Duodenibacillus massiliensis]|uniref:hypothetical protein n=1 Tax=Duodenibacillus massiliensis TaxID=1852381 RepID=UPI00258B5897|nr:hypothetical protein [uncultured Duodenibacillus sp.]